MIVRVDSVALIRAPSLLARRGKLRTGMSLLEVIVSMAIFLAALGAIGPLIQMGMDRSLDVQLQATALQKCQSKLSELMVGAEQLSQSGESSFSDNPPDENWQWSADLSQDFNGITGLWGVVVHVSIELDGGRKVQVSLGQMIIDPTLRGAPNPGNGSGSTPVAGTTVGGITVGGGS